MSLNDFKLTEKTKWLIEGAQQFLLDEPVPINKLAKNLGIAEIRYENLNSDISGKLVRIGGGEYVMTINDNDIRRRKRFTVAHELAHFLLHKDKIGDGITENALYRSGLSTSLEVEANRLAADILMPIDKIEEYIKQIGKQNVVVGKLSDVFGVAMTAMTVRLGIPYNPF